jgi:hypothetical protein
MMDLRLGLTEFSRIMIFRGDICAQMKEQKFSKCAQMKCTRKPKNDGM